MKKVHIVEIDGCDKVAFSNAEEAVRYAVEMKTNTIDMIYDTEEDERDGNARYVSRRIPFGSKISIGIQEVNLFESASEAFIHDSRGWSQPQILRNENKEIPFLVYLTLEGRPVEVIPYTGKYEIVFGANKYEEAASKGGRCICWCRDEKSATDIAIEIQNDFIESGSRVSAKIEYGRGAYPLAISLRGSIDSSLERS